MKKILIGFMILSSLLFAESRELSREEIRAVENVSTSLMEKAIKDYYEKKLSVTDGYRDVKANKVKDGIYDVISLKKMGYKELSIYSVEYYKYTFKDGKPINLIERDYIGVEETALTSFLLYNKDLNWHKLSEFVKYVKLYKVTNIKTLMKKCKSNVLSEESRCMKKYVGYIDTTDKISYEKIAL